ncbi:hypothetical protein LVJ94_49875 [Pendulispora rubella]|uniref:Uncharacterized protein n=1 Tax=Pendulispora rubella TaxID=2741070 RepID=A0ABZ2L6Z4_9BACT
MSFARTGHAEEPKPQAIVAGALNAFGGESRVRAVHGVHMKFLGHWNLIEGSERPEPPWDVSYEEGETWFDFTLPAWREKATSWYSAPGSPAARFPWEVTVAGQVAMRTVAGKARPGSAVLVADAEERLAHLPDRLLLAALDAPDLHREPGESLGGNPQYVLSFRWNRQPVRIWIDAHTWRITEAELVHPMPTDHFWRVRGDVRDRVHFQQWQLQPGGYWYPAQTDLTRAGIPCHSTTLTAVERDVTPPGGFAIPDDVRAAFRAEARGPGDTPAPGEKPVLEIAPGIWFAAARWNSLLVAQADGTILVDAPISDVYFGRTIDEARRRFGTTPSALVLTDAIVPQLSGVREAVARGLPVHLLDANRNFVESLLAQPHTLAPDALARSGRAPVLRSVAARTSLGQGAGRIELVPMRTSLGERVLLVWFPAARLLWTASALGTAPTPSRKAELEAVIAREHLDVGRVVGAQLGPMRWP